VGESVLRFLKCVCVCCLGVVHAPVQSTRRTLPSFRVHRSSQCFRNFSMISSGDQENEHSASDAISARSGSWWTHTENGGSGRPPAHDVMGCVYLRMTDGCGKSEWTAFASAGHWHFKKPCLFKDNSSRSCWHHRIKKIANSSSEESLAAARSWSPRIVFARPCATALPQPASPTCKWHIQCGCYNRLSWNKTNLIIIPSTKDSN